MMRKEGYEVDTAVSAVEAKDWLGQGQCYDVLISDISMPEMSGLELLRYSRGVASETEVILMTAYGSKQTAIEALNDSEDSLVAREVSLVNAGVMTPNEVRARHGLAPEPWGEGPRGAAQPMTSSVN